MITHPDSYTAFAFMRHEDLIATCDREPTAIAAAGRLARPGILRGTRAWLGNALVRLGPSLHGDPQEPMARRSEMDRLLPAVIARRP